MIDSELSSAEGVKRGPLMEVMMILQFGFFGLHLVLLPIDHPHLYLMPLVQHLNGSELSSAEGVKRCSLMESMIYSNGSALACSSV